MISFDDWYLRQTGINTNDLTDEEYNDLLEDEMLMGCYQSDMALAAYCEGGGDADAD